MIGGFSQGAVMSLAVGLGRGRPRPLAVIAFSGFVPIVEGWELGAGAVPADRDRARHLRRRDPGRARAPLARASSRSAGAEVLYRESPIDHAIDPRFVAELVPWLADAVRAAGEA